MTTSITAPAAAPIAASPSLRVPFLDLVTQHQPLEEELVALFRTALRGAAFVGGSEVAGFEREFAAAMDCPDSVALNSGTDALRLGYIALGVKPGDEIITVSHTFIATTEAITQAGGVVKFVDIDPVTMTIDPRAIEAAITPRTVGIVPVHLYGQPADMDPILEIANRHGLWVVEDACQAHGARYKGRPAGSLGALAAFSFYPGKNLGALGEGGGVTSTRPELLTAIRQLRDHGQKTKYYHDVEGYNARLDAIQCAFLRVKLRHLADWNASRRRIAALYRDGLSDVAELRLPVEADYAHHVYHLYVVRTPQRDELAAFLSQRNIGTGLHYPLPLHLQRAYEHLNVPKGALPATEETAATLLSLPMFPDMSDAQVEHVVTSTRAFFRQ